MRLGFFAFDSLVPRLLDFVPFNRMPLRGEFWEIYRFVVVSIDGDLGSSRRANLVFHASQKIDRLVRYIFHWPDFGDHPFNLFSRARNGDRDPVNPDCFIPRLCFCPVEILKDDDAAPRPIRRADLLRCLRDFFKNVGQHAFILP